MYTYINHHTVVNIKIVDLIKIRCLVVFLKKKKKIGDTLTSNDILYGGHVRINIFNRSIHDEPIS